MAIFAALQYYLIFMLGDAGGPKKAKNMLT